MSREMPLPAAVACALTSAALIASATRPWGLGALAAVGYVPAFVAIARQRSALRGALLAALAALGSASVGYEAAIGIAPWAYPAAVALVALPFAAAGAVATRVPWSLWALPPLWCAAEFVPAQSALFGVYALPLTAVGYSQADLPTVHLARLSSVTAVSLALLAHNALVAAGALAALDPAAAHARASRVTGSRPASPRTLRLLRLTALAALYLVAAAAWRSAPAPSDPAVVTVRVVQPHLPRAAYVAAEALPASRAALIEHLLALSSAPSADGSIPDLTVWPEASWPGPLEAEDAAVAERVLAGVGPLLFGAFASGPAATNSVFWFDGAALRRAYDKQRLVPVAESWLEPGPPGGAAPLAAVPGALIAPTICYDVVFPAVARAAAKAGATLLVAITDDGFAGASDVPLQHLRAARFRAVETGLPLILASNMGPSAAFAADGARLAGSPHGLATSWQAQIALPAASSRPTPYVRFGDSAGAFTSLLSLAAGVLACFKGGGPFSRPRPT